MLIIFSMGMMSCNIKDIDLSLGIEEKEEENITETKDANKLSDEELFFQLKAKQSEKNQLLDINIRKAIFYGIDRKRIVEELLGDYGSVLDSLFNHDSPYYYPAWSQYNYDPEKAKEYLAKAGYGPDNPLFITIGACESNIAREKIENIIREDLMEIGINIWKSNMSSKDWYGEILKNGDYELGVWALYSVDGSNISNYFSENKIPPMETEENKDCNNFYWYQSDDVESIFRQISYSDGEEKKAELYRELQEKISNDAFVLPLFSRIFSIAYNKKVENIKINPVNGDIFYNIDSWRLNIEEDEESIVNIGYEEEPAVINPFVSNSLFNKYINNVLFRGLWGKDKNGEYIPVLAESYDEVSDSSTLTNRIINVKLKDDIFWEDGSPIISEDIYFTWQKVLESDSGIGYKDQFENIENIEIINDKEFRILFKEKVEDWQELFNVIFPSHGVLEEDEQINLFEDYTFGCGTYKILEWVKGEYILLERNMYSIEKVPEIKYIKFLFNSDVNKLISGLEGGDIDVLSVPADLELLNKIEEDENLGLIVEEGNIWEHLAICLKPKED